MRLKTALVHAELRVQLLVVLLIGVPAPSAAQSVVGTVRARLDQAPLHDAFVSLVDSAGAIVAAVRTDRRGRFTVSAPEAGVFAVVARSPGFNRVISGWLDVVAAETLDVTLRLDRSAVVLSPIVVSAQRDSLQDFTVRGVPIRTLAGSIITEAEVVYAAVGTTRMTEVLQNLRIPTLYLKHFEVKTGDPRIDGPRTCLTFVRTDGCVTIMIDGLRLASDEQLYHVDEAIRPEQVKGIVMLRPADAGVLFGSETANGVLMIITKTGGR